jgi:hypothetical protein
LEALQKRFSNELGEFRLWCSIANRAIELSGVPAEEVEEKVGAHYRVTTHIFRKAGWGLKPMSTPPWQVSAETAANGGMGYGLLSDSDSEVNPKKRKLTDDEGVLLDLAFYCVPLHITSSSLVSL